MNSSSEVAAFVDKALEAGVPHDWIVRVLLARGWPENRVNEALAVQLQQRTGLVIPGRRGSGASAKEAFFYLLIFSTLATWTIGLGSLAFALINRWVADPLFTNAVVFETHSIASSLAATIVAFPIYLLLSRVVVRESAANPERLDAPVRKWLTYMALVIAAGVFMGDLITALEYLLRGELTSRFLSKVFVVLALSAGVFFYYYVGIRRSEKPEAAVGLSIDRAMAWLGAGVIVLAVVLGFSALGPPKVQRDLTADTQRVAALYRLNLQVDQYWTAHAELPRAIDGLPGTGEIDPIRRVAYEYHRGSGSQYQLCAHFAAASDRQENRYSPNVWAHPAGRACFQLDAAVPQLQTPVPME